MSKNYRAPTTSQKHRDFMEPMGNKPVTKLPGVGKAIGNNLSNAGYSQASNVLGEYLKLDQDKGRFQDFMQDVGNANSRQSSATYESLNDWRKEFL